MTTVQATQVSKKKRAYVPPQVRSERLLVPDLFQPSCFVDPENPPNCL